MSLKFPYLNLSLRYLHGAKSTTVFSYPSGETAVKAPFNSAAIVAGFMNLEEFYVTGCHEGKRFFTFVNVDDTKQSDDRLELTITAGSDILISGRSLLNFFNNIKTMLDGDEPFNDETMENVLLRSGFEEEPLRGSIAYAGNSLEGKPCYKQFVSASELGNLLSFPRQSGYASYSEVAFVPVTAVANPQNQIPQITQPLAQTFSVVCPKDVKPSAETVELTDHLALTYTRTGFEPATVTFEVGTTNRYVRILGAALIVNDAEKAGIVFTQRVAYKVVSAKGGLVKTYTILINGRTATRADGIFEVASTDFTNNGMVNIQVSSTNYFTTSVDYTSEELFTMQPLEIVLVPEQLTVVLRLDFGGGRVIEQQLMLEKASTEYRNLRAGNFHGFRAHRLMGGEPETYNVDAQSGVRQAVQGATTLNDRFANHAEGEKPAEEKEVQKVQKSAAELRAERQQAEVVAEQKEAVEKPFVPEKENKNDKTDRDGKGHRSFAYANDIPKKIDELADDPDDDDERESRSKISPMLLAVIAVVLIVAGIVWYLFTLLPSADDADDQAEGVDITQNVTDSTQKIVVTDDIPGQEPSANEPAAQQPAGPTADEQADVAYLNANSVWKLSDLKSQRYRDFFTTLGEGDIQTILESDYFAVENQGTNVKAQKVADYLWEAKGTFAEKRNVNEMKKLKEKESIDVNALYESLSRMRDAKPNTEPRPKK